MKRKIITLKDIQNANKKMMDGYKPKQGYVTLGAIKKANKKMIELVSK